MIGLKHLVGWFRQTSSSGPDPHIMGLRVDGNRTALVFLHGFSGTADGTWTDFAGLFHAFQACTATAFGPALRVTVTGRMTVP